MKRILIALLAMVMFGGSSVAIVTAQEATPDASNLDALSQPTDGSNPVDPSIGDDVTYYDESGNASGTVTVDSIERGWEDYDEFYEPERGTEYVAFVVTVESTIPRGAIAVEDYDFNLQTASGQLWGTAFTSSEAADPALLDDSVSLASGDSETFTIVFQVYEDEPLAHLFWQPDSGFLITAAQLEGE